jgi:hypothetical protein
VISTTAVETLMEAGRQRGGLDINDIRRALLVDAMSIEELADVLARLEEAGISVEIEPTLLTPRHRKMTLRGAKPVTEPPRHGEQMTVDHGRLAILALSIKAARDNSSRAPGTALPHVQKPAAVFVLVAALILLLIALSVWRFA